MDMERITFTGGYWEFRTTVTRGMRKAFRSAGLKSIKTLAELEGFELDFEDPDAIKAFAAKHPDAIDANATEDAYLLEGTIEINYDGRVYKGIEITVELLDSTPDEIVQPVLDKMQELYVSMGEEEAANLDMTLPSMPQETQQPTAI